MNCSNWIADPIINPFQPTLDRHVGQRNLHVVEGAPGEKFQFVLQATNVFPVKLDAVVEVDSNICNSTARFASSTRWSSGSGRLVRRRAARDAHAHDHRVSTGHRGA